MPMSGRVLVPRFGVLEVSHEKPLRSSSLSREVPRTGLPDDALVRGARAPSVTPQEVGIFRDARRCEISIRSSRPPAHCPAPAPDAAACPGSEARSQLRLRARGALDRRNIALDSA